jgi:Peptidase family S41/N-terminal domain of Peptidase_S41 in eukaryotic IRBP
MERSKKTVVHIAAVVGVVFALASVLFVMTNRAQSGPPQKDISIDKATQEEVVEGIISNLGKYYVFPEKASAMAEHLRKQMQNGDYDSVTSAEKFAEALTESLQRITQDKHLEVRYFEKAVPQRAPGLDQSPEEQAEELFEQLRHNFGFENVGRLRGNIGYIDLHAFARPQQAGERIAAAMTLLADTKALIIDLRRCDGGDPETVMLFASYLFDKRTHLNDIYWRDENRTEKRWTQEVIPGKKYSEARKIYLLTSSDTFSGGEDFAYALKNSGRATLVGETTGGGANAGNPHRLSAHFMMFVPSGRPISPVTHTNWEGVGVTPDIKASAENALEVAHIALVKELLAAETDPRWKEVLQRTLADPQ